METFVQVFNAWGGVEIGFERLQRSVAVYNAMQYVHTRERRVERGATADLELNQFGINSVHHYSWRHVFGVDRRFSVIFVFSDIFGEVSPGNTAEAEIR